MFDQSYLTMNMADPMNHYQDLLIFLNTKTH